MTLSTLRRAAALASLIALAAVPSAAQKARFDVVGRGPLPRARATGLAVFRGADGHDYAYAGTFGECRGCIAGRMYVWDVSDPAHPVLTDSVTVDARNAAAIAVNASATLAVLTREGARSGRNGIVVLDLKDPAHPRELADYWETLTGGAHSVTIDGSYAYVADLGGAEMSVIDLSNPADPREVGRWGVAESPGRFLQDITVRDGLAYLSYWNDGVQVLDVGNGMKGGSPAHPRQVSQFRYRTQWHDNPYGNTAYAFPYTSRAGKKYLFVADQIVPGNTDLSRRFETGGFVHVFAVQNVQAPVEVARYTPAGTGVHSFWIANDTMYVAAWSGGVRAVDLSGGDLHGELRGREVASISTGDPHGAVPDVPFAWTVVPHGGNLFVTDFNSGLWILRLVPGTGSGGE